MRLLVLGGDVRDDRVVRTLARLRLERTLWPLHLCFWAPDLEAARLLMTAVGAGTCLREVTPALLVHVDVALLCDERGELDATLGRARRAREAGSKKGTVWALPAVARLRDGEVDWEVLSPEHAAVCGVLRRAMGGGRGGFGQLVRL